MLIIPGVILAITSDEDRDYMEWLYREYHRLMYKIAFEYCHAQMEVQDIVSDSCVALIGKIEKLRYLEKAELKLYIFSTVRNTAIDHYRKRRRLDARFFHLSEERANRMTDGVDVVGQIELKDELNRVLQIICELPEKEKTVMYLKYSVGLPDAEIAEIVGLSPNSVRKYVERARDHIKSRIYGREGA